VSESDTETTEDRPPSVRITVLIQNRYTLDSESVTGRQIKELAGIPPTFALFRRGSEGKESVGDDVEVQVRNGDHFFAQPGSQREVGHGEARR